MRETEDLTIWLGLHMDEPVHQLAFDLLMEQSGHLHLPAGINLDEMPPGFGKLRLSSTLGLNVVGRDLKYHERRLGVTSDELPRGNIIQKFGLPPAADTEARDPEAEEAARIDDYTIGGNIWDIHGTRCDYDFPFLGTRSRYSRTARGIASLLGVPNVLICPEPHVASRYDDYVGWDLGRDSQRLFQVMGIAEAICAGWKPPIRKMKEWANVGGVLKVDMHENGLARDYDPLEPLPNKLRNSVISSKPIHPSLPLHVLFSDNEKGERFPKNKYYCEVVTPFDAWEAAQQTMRG